MKKITEDARLKLPGALRIVPLGDSAVEVILGSTIDPDTYARVQAFAETLNRQPFIGMVEFVPTFASVAVYFDGLSVLKAYPDRIEPGDRHYPYPVVVSLLEEMVDRDPLQGGSGRTVTIPVCYGGEFGPDLDAVAEYHGLTADEVVAIHSAGSYLVYMLGFAPGFAYLGGLPERIATPRRPSPRLAIPPGTVGIAGNQTGVYPLETPGGWQLIGRTPAALFRPHAMPPTLLQAGDRVKFTPISRREFEGWKEAAP